MKKLILLFLIIPLIATSQYNETAIESYLKNEIRTLNGNRSYSNYNLSNITKDKRTLSFTYHRYGAKIKAKYPVIIRATTLESKRIYVPVVDKGMYQFKIFGTEQRDFGHFEYNQQGFLTKATYYFETPSINGERQYDKNTIIKTLHFKGEKYAYHQVGWQFDRDSPILGKTTYEVHYYNGKTSEVWDFTGNIYKNYLWSDSEKQIIITELVNRIMHGISRVQTENEQTLIQGQYVNGLKEGKWNHYHRTGIVQGKGTYINDNQTGEWEYYYESGKLHYKGSYTNNLQTGEWHTYSETGKITDTSDYNANGDKKGITEELVSVEEFEAIGLLQIQEQFGIQLFDYENENITMKSTYKHGSPDGKVECYYPDGTYFGYYHYNNDFLDYGDLKLQYKSGKTFVKISRTEEGEITYLGIFKENGEALMEENFD